MELKYTTLFIMPDNDLFYVPEDYSARFAASAVRLVSAPTAAAIPELAALAPDADALLVGSGRYPVSDPLLSLLPRCRLIVRMGAGYDNIDVPAATRRGIVASNMPGNLPEEVADHTIALFLTSLRRIGQQDRAVRARGWDPTLAAPATRLAGQTVGFVGFGRIARLVARKMSGFGLHYLAYDPFIPADAGVELGVRMVSFEELLRHADVVTLHLPATPETRNMFDASAFSLMKPSAILVNTARGFLIDEQALLSALNEGRLRGAALDVFQDEPMRPDNPLLKCDNVVMTPHTAGYSIEGLADFFGFGHSLIADFLTQGVTPRWILNPKVAETRSRQEAGQ
jgi:D-3-phosphoglycerate dehydrogenase / 2-oxoglutarate reductase